MTPKMTPKNYEAIKIYNQKEKIFTLKGEIQSLKQENQQLKELLKECRDYVVNTLIELKNGYCYEENDYYHETKTLLTKIDNAIGEKK